MILPNLNKAAYCTFWWDNGKGNRRDNCPDYPTVFGMRINPDELAADHKDFPLEDCLARATRLGCLDEWYPACKVQFANTHSLRFKGEDAQKIWTAWKAVVFGKKKTKETK